MLWSNKFVFILALILVSSFAGAVNLGISPSQISFSGNSGEKICKNFSLLSGDYEGYLIGEDKWSTLESRSLTDYNSKTGLEVKYSRFILANRLNMEEICIKSKQAGRYYGVLLFHAENTGVGAWLSVNISGEKSFSGITGNVIGSRSNNYLIVSLVSLVFLSFLLLVFLVVLFRRLER